MEKNLVQESVNESYNEEQPHYVPSELVNRFSHINGNTVYHCYLIELKQEFIYDVSPRDIVLAIRCELDPEFIRSMEFEMCINRGSLAVKLKYTGTINLGPNEVWHLVQYFSGVKVLLCRKFQITIFGILFYQNMDKLMGILNKISLEDNPEMDYLLLPATPIHMRPLIIDWPSVTSVLSSIEGCNNHVEEVRTKDHEVCSCKLENSLVYAPHNGHFYVITDRMELDGNSPLRLRDGKAMTYKEYYEKKYGIHLRHENQQLYNGRHTFPVKNYHLKSRQAREKESTNGSVGLPPELCSIIMSPISAGTIYSFSFIPSIIYRLESLLLASNLKKMCKQNDIPTFKILEAITAKECQEPFHYESLETLGDSFLKSITCQHLYQTHPSDNEGLLTEKKKKIISNVTLCRLGCNSKLTGFIRSSPFDPKKWIIPGDRSRNVALKEELVSDMTKIYVRGNRKIKHKIIADVVEALIGVVLSTVGEKATLKFVNWIGIKVDFHVTPNKRLLSTQPEKLVNVAYFESLLNYSFNDSSLLLEALTHGSYKLPEIPCYQRLEFLGDAVLDFLITEHLYNKYPGLSPGLLTDMRSASVNNDCYARAAIKAELHKHILHSSQGLEKNIVKAINSFDELSTEPTFGWDTETCFPKALADIIESLTGAVMVDSGFNKDAVFKSIMPLLEPLITPETIQIHPFRELQEHCQKQYYRLEKPLVSTSDGLTCVTIRVRAYGKNYEKTFKAGRKDTARRMACKEVLIDLKKINSVRRDKQ